MCLTELNEILFKEDIKIKMFYETDFSVLTIVAEMPDSTINKRHETNNKPISSELDYRLIESLSDKFIVNNGRIIMEFNIGALHNSVYEERLKYLKEYFNRINSFSKVV